MSSYGIRCTRTIYSGPDRLSPSLKAAQKKHNLGLAEKAKQDQKLVEEDRAKQLSVEEHAAWIRQQLASQESVEWTTLRCIVETLDPLYAKMNSWDEAMSPQEHLNYTATRERFIHQASVLGLDPEYTFQAMYPLM